MSQQNVIISKNSCSDLKQCIQKHPHDKLFVLTDEHTRELSLPLLESIPEMKQAVHITIGAEDIHKTLDTLAHVWTTLSQQGGTRHSLLVNLGGGMVTDLGGFAAATFKRGINYINIPTTLLAMVDASVGGKTGINFNGLKNEIGAFAPASEVLIDSVFLRTLDMHNLLSGYAEMVKHGLISDVEHWSKLMTFNFMQVDYEELRELIGRSVKTKEDIVTVDPFEKGIRKALNLGHTVGHAFESFALETGHPVLHGYAVAWGLVCELYLAHTKTGFPMDKMRQTIQFIKEHYGKLAFNCKHYNRLYELMRHDKKNASADEINFTLLSNIGEVKINQTASREEIFEALDFYSETM